MYTQEKYEDLTATVEALNQSLAETKRLTDTLGNFSTFIEELEEVTKAANRAADALAAVVKLREEAEV